MNGADGTEGRRTAKVGKTHRKGVRGPQKTASYTRSLTGASKETNPDQMRGMKQEA